MTRLVGLILEEYWNQTKALRDNQEKKNQQLELWLPFNFDFHSEVQIYT